METEIKGDWKGYLKRFHLPDIRIFKGPLLGFGVCLLLQVVFSVIACCISTSQPLSGNAWILICVSSLIIGTFLYAIFRNFWNVILEESKGFWADVLMWVLYIILTLVSVVLPVWIVLHLFHML